MKCFALANAFGFEHLQMEERPEPQPGPGEVMVRIRAASLNYRDLLVAQGKYDPKLALPRIVLSDGAGEVVALGEGAGAWRVGDRVVLPFMPGWLEGPLNREKSASALGGAVDGVLRELICVSEAVPLAVPDHLSFEEAATLPCAAVTGWNGLFTAGNLRPGQTVLIQGTGGVSLFGLQLAKQAGARVILISSQDEKLARARALGADDLINYRAVPEWEKRVLELTDAQGVDLTLEVGGAGTLSRTLRATAYEGHVSLIGVLTGLAGELAIGQLLHKALTVRGVYVGSRADFAQLLAAVSRHGLRPVIDRVFSWHETIAAYRHLESGTHFGKVVLRLD